MWCWLKEMFGDMWYNECVRMGGGQYISAGVLERKRGLVLRSQYAVREKAWA